MGNETTVCDDMNSTPRRIYLAGPMTGIKDFNRASFTAAKAALASQGFDVVNPADHDLPDDTWPLEKYLSRDVALLSSCDSICLLPGWFDSRGATFEAFVAHTTGKQLFEFDGAFSPYLKDLPANKLPAALQAWSIVYGARNTEYGHPRDDFGRTAKLWSAILGQDVSPVQVSLCMILLKVSRLCHDYQPDSVVDIAGYAQATNRVVGI